MILTIKNRLKLCWEILTARSGHNHPSHIKQLSIFMRGYEAGYKDCFIDNGIKRDNTGLINPDYKGG